jgi:hypothetical protein
MKRFSSFARTTLLVFLLALVVNGAQAKGPQVRDVIKKAYDVRPGGTLNIDMDHGNVEVETTSGNKVLIELERIATAEDRDLAEEILDEHEYAFDKRGNDVYIRSRYDEDRGMMKWRQRNKIKIQVLVQVPERYSVDFTNGAGNVDIVDVNGRIEGRTGAGNIILDDVRGFVDVSSGAGNIEISGDIESAEANTGAGNVSLYGLRGAVEANTGAGNVYAEITRQPERDSKLHSGAGNVTVELSRNVSVYVDATAALGSAECDFPLKVSKKWLKKSFSGEINGGGPELRMYAGVGNVTLRRN